MSKALRLFTFHGQGSTFDVTKVAFKNITVEQLYKNRFKDYCLNENCYKPDIISLLNNLSYQDYLAGINEPVNKTHDSLVLGHSLGELQFLSCNNLISIEDLMFISTKRDELMKSEMARWKERNLKTFKSSRLNTDKDDASLENSMNKNEWISTYSLLLSPKILKQEPDFIKETLVPMLDNDIGSKSLTLSLYNTKNSVVLTGLTSDFDELFDKDSKTTKSILKKIKLPNVSQIAFHNKKFLKGIEEPLNDFIFSVLVKNKTSHVESLDVPVFSSYSNRVNRNLIPAMEDFTRSSFNTVPFYENCQRVKDLIAEEDYVLERVDLGPSDVLRGILNKNGVK